MHHPGISTMFYVEQYRTPTLDHINVCLQLNILLKNFILKVIIDSEEIGKIVQKSHETFPANTQLNKNCCPLSPKKQKGQQGG